MGYGEIWDILRDGRRFSWVGVLGVCRVVIEDSLDGWVGVKSYKVLNVKVRSFK